MGCAACMERKHQVVITCLSCGKRLTYSYIKTLDLKQAFQNKPVICRCGESNYDLDNPKEIY